MKVTEETLHQKHKQMKTLINPLLAREIQLYSAFHYTQLYIDAVR
jgi:hypothetical protein